jgi:hypothetical protein
VDAQSSTDPQGEAPFHKQTEMRNIHLVLGMQPDPVPRSAADSTKCTAAFVNRSSLVTTEISAGCELGSFGLHGPPHLLYC